MLCPWHVDRHMGSLGVWQYRYTAASDGIMRVYTSSTSCSVTNSAGVDDERGAQSKHACVVRTKPRTRAGHA